MAQTGKRLSTMPESRVRSLGGEDPLEKGMAIHSSTIAWKRTGEPDRDYNSRAHKELGMTEPLTFLTSTVCTYEILAIPG